MGKSRWLIGGAMAYGAIALLMMVESADEIETVKPQSPSMESGKHTHLSPLLNPRINLLDEFEPLLNEREKVLLFPVHHPDAPPVNRVNGVIIGS